jgi:hypothetical protein
MHGCLLLQIAREVSFQAVREGFNQKAARASE